jgi:hypothetical protein
VIGALRVAPQESDLSASMAACDYLANADGGNQTLELQVGTGFLGQSGVADNFGVFKTESTVVKTVPGLGDSAQEYDAPDTVKGLPPGVGSACVLSVTKGSVTMLIEIRPSVADCLQKARQVATFALAKA